MKLEWKTQGRVIGVPIYTPFNQVNLSTGKGYCKDFNAKFWQAERHGAGVLEVAYSFNMMEKKAWSWRGVMASLQTFDMFLPAATLPWAMISLTYQGLILGTY